jgi:hypothetical protein
MQQIQDCFSIPDSREGIVRRLKLELLSNLDLLDMLALIESVFALYSNKFQSKDIHIDGISANVRGYGQFQESSSKWFRTW